MSLFQQDLFSPTSCNPCLLKPSTAKPGKLSRCMGCKLILYCSADHQKLDWEIHKPFCQAASAILAGRKVNHIFSVNGPVKTQEDLNVTILKVKYMFRELLKRSLDFHEEELTSFPVMCAMCFATNMFQLYQCKKCNAVSYCSPEHEQQDAPIHRAECLQLKMYYCKFKINCEMVLKLAVREKCNLLETNLTKAIKNMFGVEFPPDPTEKLDDYRNFTFVSDFSCVATVSYIMQHLDMESYKGDQFTLYVAGATIDEIFFSPTHVQFFFACFPKIMKLNVILVGPEIEGVPKSTTFNMGGGRTMLRTTHRGTLEEYFLERKTHMKPNILACFNCGFSEHTQKGKKDLWCKAIRYMLDMPEIPILFTSYTSLEADFDYGALMKVVEERKDFSNVRLDRIVVKQQNPYKDLRPLRHWQFNDPERIFYRNGYLQAVRIKLNDY